MKRPIINILKFSDAPQDAELRVHTQRDHEKYLDAPIDQVYNPFVYCLSLNVPWELGYSSSTHKISVQLDDFLRRPLAPSCPLLLLPALTHGHPF